MLEPMPKELSRRLASGILKQADPASDGIYDSTQVSDLFRAAQPVSDLVYLLWPPSMIAVGSFHSVKSL